MHRFVLPLALVVGALAFPASASAQRDRGQLQVFGGVTMRDAATAPVFGGSIAIPITGNIHVIAEGGRMTDIMSPTLATLLDLTPIDVNLSALYGAAGVRIIASPRAMRPYAEATAGVARTELHFDGIGPVPDSVINTALQLLNRTDPLFGLGAGVLLQGGPVFADLGYRYQRISSDNTIQSLLSGGGTEVNQVRLGIGLRF